MRNDGKLRGAIVKMYSKTGLTEEIIKSVRRLWDELTRYELSLLLSCEAVSEMFKDQIAQCRKPGFMDEKFDEYLKLLDWVYVFERSGEPVGFMAVAEDQLLSIYFEEWCRGWTSGSYQA